jgi:ubiquinone/menaquinone biosynthesis C-methylase UbiE
VKRRPTTREATDAQVTREQLRRDWDLAASSWRKYDERLRNEAAPLTRRLLELARIRPGHRVLDLGSGTGEPGLPAAEMVGPSGFVLLTDQSPGMLEVARDKARAAGLRNVDFQVAAAERLEVEAESFDVVLSRGAIDLFADPVRALRIAHAALVPGGRIAVSANGRPEANTYFTVPFVVLLKYATLPQNDPTARGAFSFADPERLRSVLAEAGFHEPAVETLAYPAWRFGTGREYWTYMRQFSLVASLLEKIPPERHDEVGDEIAAAAAGGDPDGRVQLGCEAVLASGVK